MSDSIEYAKMSEIPVSSCEITVKEAKKKKDIKNKAINKANARLDEAVEIKPKRKKLFNFFKSKKKKEKAVKAEENIQQENKKGRFDIVTAQLITIFALVVAILLTNIFWENSAMNNMFKHVFNKEKNVTLNYNEFDAVAPTVDRAVSLDNGVMSVSGKGSIYSPVAGEVTCVEEKDGKWEMTITHTDEFKSVISGLDCCFYEKGYQIYSTTPIGYSSGDAVTVEMFNNGNLITDYSIADGVIIWE